MLQESKKTKLLKELSLLSSDFQGEQIAALNAIQRTLKSVDLSWNDFIQSLDSADLSGAFTSGYSAGYSAGCNTQSAAPPNDYYQMLLSLKQREDSLNTWTVSFINNLLSNKWKLTAKQKACINKLYDQFC